MSIGSLGNIPNRFPLSKQRGYKLQEVAARLLPGERVSWCSRASKAPVIEIRRAGESCFYHGLAVCGSVWLCPVCARRISAARRDELARASAKWSGSLLLVTITLAHTRQDKLSELLAALSDAWKALRSGRKWQSIEEKYQLAASAASLEVTFSQENGFHPHKHILFFSRLEPGSMDAKEFERELSERWRAMLARRGRYASEYYGLSVLAGDKPVAGYIAKWGVAEELALSQSKSASGEHVSMFQLLELAGDGVSWAAMAFKEYAKAIKSKRALVWSAHARQVLELTDELTDEQAASKEPEESELVFSLSRDEWRLVCKREQRGELLQVAEQSGGDGVLRFLEKLREVQDAIG